MGSLETLLIIFLLIALSAVAHKLVLNWLGLKPKNFRESLVFLFTFLGGSYFFLEFLLPETIGSFRFGTFHEAIILGVRLFSAMAIGLGIINLLRVHGENLLKSKKGWPNSLALIFAMFTVFTIYINDFNTQEARYAELGRLSVLSKFVDEIEKRVQAGTHSFEELSPSLLQGLKEFEIKDADTKSFLRVATETTKTEAYKDAYDVALSSTQSFLEQTLQASELKLKLRLLEAAGRDLAEYHYQNVNTKKAADFVFQGFFVPLGSAMFSLLAFYVATAAYRTFRIRSLEAALMMTTAIIVMLGQIPHGPIYISEDLPAIRLWLLKYLNTPAFRAIFFGSAVAALAMAVRMWFSLDASPLATSDEKKKS